MCRFRGVSQRSGHRGPAGRRRARAVTLVEVVAILAVLAILGAVATRALRPTGVTLTAQRGLLASHLRYVQAMAMAAGAAHDWGVQIQTDRYGLRLDGALPTGVSLPGTAGAERVFPAGVSVSSGSGLVVFDAWGSPGASDVTITLTDGGSSQTVVVTAVTGFVR